MTTVKPKPYEIEKKESEKYGKSVNITTHPIFIDTAAFIVPTPGRDQNGNETDKLRYRVRALLVAEQNKDFIKDVTVACAWLLNGKTQFHPRLAPANCSKELITADFLRVGSEEIAQWKAYDAELEGVVPAPKKKYKDWKAYLEPLVYFYATAVKPVPMFNKFGEKITPENDDFFRPSFKGQLKITIKWIPQPGSTTPLKGGRLVAYMNSVKFINPLTKNLMFEEQKFADTPETEEDDLLLNASDADLQQPQSSKVQAPSSKEQDDVAGYLESF